MKVNADWHLKKVLSVYPMTLNQHSSPAKNLISWYLCLIDPLVKILRFYVLLVRTSFDLFWLACAGLGKQLQFVNTEGCTLLTSGQASD